MKEPLSRKGSQIFVICCQAPQTRPNVSSWPAPRSETKVCHPGCGAQRTKLLALDDVDATQRPKLPIVGGALAWVMMGALALPACGDDSANDEALAAKQENFKKHCYAAVDASCEKGFQCNSFFVTSKYNSVDHCKSELHKEYDSAATQLTSSALDDCSSTCELMLSDVEALTCDKFDQATFNTYHCG